MSLVDTSNNAFLSSILDRLHDLENEVKYLKRIEVPKRGESSMFNIRPDNLLSGVTDNITSTIPVQVIPAQGEGVAIFVTALLVTNAVTGTSTFVKITNGSGGTTIFTGYAVAGGGFSVSLTAPLVLSNNTALFAQCDFTGGDVRVSAAGYKG